ncbi:VanZ family protein [Streptomyces sp. NPDC048718]|uniref:VanZ family protein n=1 Tax=Streptomyces sp. NPDC048718 TaxID=3365587 RepID=UPI00371D1746
MIEASIGAVPGLFSAFFVMALLFAAPTAFIAKSRNRPPLLPALLATSIAGVLAVTLLPGSAGGAMAGICDIGRPVHMLTSASALLNIALFAPSPLLAVLLFRRPVTVGAISLVCSATVELIQATVPMGRACSATDLAANATGALLGVCTGAVWLRLRGRRISHVSRDVSWGTSLAAIGAAALAGWFYISVSTTDVVAADDKRSARLDALDGADEWMEESAREIFGKQTKSLGSTSIFEGNRTVITMKTDQGELVGWWPDRSLERAWSIDNTGEEGDLDADQVQAVGQEFAQKWFPTSVADSQKSLNAMGEDNSKVYRLTYRRYSQGVMMPMRLDITITSAGRIMGFTSDPTRDPPITPASISKKEAKRLAEKETGSEAEAAVLLAQKVSNEWRPVWMVSVKSGSKDPNLFIDAASGRRVEPDRV